jgi:transposase
LTIGTINIDDTLKEAEQLLSEEKGMSSATKSMMKVLLLVIRLLLERLNVTSSNSSKPPSQDPNRQKNEKRGNGNDKGGQKGHEGRTLEKVSEPDETIDILVTECDGCANDLQSKPSKYYEARQVFEVIIKRHVVEYKSEVKECDICGVVTVGTFPSEVSKAVQYGTSVKVLSVYVSQGQLIPYKRVEEFFTDQLDIPLSSGTIYNFNKEAFEKLSKFEEEAKEGLLLSPLNHVDETGLNISGKKAWLFSISNETWTFFYPHTLRSQEAISEMGVLPFYKGILCHDYYRVYYGYGSAHALCNSHHLRELERCTEQDKQNWSKLMKELLLEINEAVIKAGGKLDELAQEEYQIQYNTILSNGKEECPLNPKIPGKRGKTAQSKSRNLLDRLEERQEDVLRFMKVTIVPFTNNLAERDIRMTKVHQKISGCFRSQLGAKIFCRIRSYLSTARKNSITFVQALTLLFDGNIPDFKVTHVKDAE